MVVALVQLDCGRNGVKCIDHVVGGEQCRSFLLIIAGIGAMKLVQELFPSEPKNFQEDTLLSHKVRSAFQAQGVAFTLLQDAHPLLKLTLPLRSAPPLQPSLHSNWVFTAGEQLELRVELVSEQGWGTEGEGSPQVVALLRTLNCCSHGIYFLQKDNAAVICFRTRLPFESSKRYLASHLREVFLEVSQQFGRFAVAAGLTTSGKDPVSSRRIGDTLQRLRELKEEFEFSRQQRKRSTNCYNLANSHIKLVSQALSLIGLCFGRMKIYAREGKVDISRCHRVYGSIKKAVEESIAKQNQRQGRFVVRGIQIESVLGEELIDQGGFSTIYRGVYKFNEMLTVSNNIEQPPSQLPISMEEGLSSSKSEEVSSGVEGILVRKLPTESEDSSYLNELGLLRFIRNQRNAHVAEYYLSCSRTDPSFNRGIYLQYYRNNLAKTYHLHPPRQLLRMTRQILNAIHFLWQNRILHRDIKELNVLVDQGGNARLIDFGSACGFHGNGPGQYTAHSNRLMATKNYFLSYGNVGIPGVTSKFTREEFNQAETFDMYSFGRILANLFELDVMKDGLVDREMLFLAMKCREVNPDDRLLPMEALCFLREVISLFVQEGIPAQEEGGTSSESSSQPQ